MSLFKNKNWPGVKQSLIASFFFLLIFNPLIDLIKNIATKGIVALVDYFFYSCGHNNGTTFLCIIALFCFITMMSREAKEMMDIYKATFAPNKETTKAIKESAHQDTENTIEEKAVAIHKLKQKVKILNFVLKALCVISIVIYILVFFFLTVYQCLPALINVSFDKCITQITPYVEDEKIEMMRSDWVSMKTKDDFDVINEEILRIREEHNLT